MHGHSSLNYLIVVWLHIDIEKFLAIFSDFDRLRGKDKMSEVRVKGQTLELVLNFEGSF